jgi:hypothetical protein
VYCIMSMSFGSNSNNSSSGPRGTIQADIIPEKINSANKFLARNPTIDVVKTEIDGTIGLLFRDNFGYPPRYGSPIDMISKSNTNTSAKIDALNALKNNGIRYFILNFDTTQSDPKYGKYFAYIQTIFNGFKAMNPAYESYELDESYESFKPPNEKIDEEIIRLNNLPPPPKTGLFGSLFGRSGGRRQKRTKKGRKISKRKTKKHKKTRTRKR